MRDIQDQGEVLEETRQQQDAQGQELQALSQQLNKAAQVWHFSIHSCTISYNTTWFLYMLFSSLLHPLGAYQSA